MKVVEIFYRNKQWYGVTIHKRDTRFDLIEGHALSKWSYVHKQL